MKHHKRIPQLKSEDAERKFWATPSPFDYFNTAKARLAAFPNLKPTSRTITQSGLSR